ncbi:serine/threonine-protein kinase bud32 [Coccidioides immitis RMSCC 3703]|uniref:non-specific serine/threonine protein kinase n=1 Tax=Coccidioides immitis RMSCC 3703 TaxID=454286 RepID=A0A0J8QUR8_COCIT|nr:serine/threonine-protein kinase bud32 [Coccidioides immitis RMSCC 3703]
MLRSSVGGYDEHISSGIIVKRSLHGWISSGSLSSSDRSEIPPASSSLPFGEAGHAISSTGAHVTPIPTMTEEFTPPPLPPPFTSNKTPPVLLAQGAEARLYKTDFLNPSFPAALKFRPSKPYRHPILDRRLTRQRVLQEARCLVKLLKEGIPVPGVLSVDWNTGQGEDETGNGDKL